jgi:hypothetical protein
LIHLAAATNEVWAVLFDSNQTNSLACSNLVQLIEAIVDKWPHSVPFVGSSNILSSKAIDKVFSF